MILQDAVSARSNPTARRWLFFCKGASGVHVKGTKMKPCDIFGRNYLLSIFKLAQQAVLTNFLLPADLKPLVPRFFTDLERVCGSVVWLDMRWLKARHAQELVNPKSAIFSNQFSALLADLRKQQGLSCGVCCVAT